MTPRSILLGLGVATAVVATDLFVIRLLLGPVPIADLGPGNAILLLSTLPGAIIIAIAAAPVGTERATRWLEDRGLPTSDGAIAYAANWLRRTRSLRGLGFTVPFISGVGAPWLVNVSDLPVDSALRDRLLDLVSTWPLSTWVAPIVGYALGAMLAEALRPPLDETGPRAADLRPRLLSGYLQSFSRQGPRVLAAVALLVTAGGAIAGIATPISLEPAGVALVTVLALAANELVGRGVVRRRQPAASPTAIEIDDAARSTTVHAVAGSAIGVIGAVLGRHLGDVAAGLGGWPENAVGLLGLLIAIGSFGVWLGHGVGLAHRVRRTHTTEPVEVAA